MLPGTGASATDGNTITVVDPSGGHQTSLLLDGSGNPVVAYRRDAIGAGLAVLHCGNPACSAGNSIATADATFDVGYRASLALDAAGNPVVSYVDKNTTDLKVLHCGNPNCSAGNTISSPATGVEVFSPTSLALDAAGNPVVSYSDAANVDLKVLHCGDPNCSAGNVIATPDAAGDVGYHTSLTLDGSGNPIVSYLDATNHDLKLLHCGDANCSAGNSITVVDPIGGEYTSLALDAGGNPVISYYDPGNTDLKVLRCGNANCSAGNVSTAPDTAGNVGEYTALALDAAGNPVVSYFDVTNSGLKVLHCGNPGCSDGNAIASLDTASSSGWFTSIALKASGEPVVSYSDPLVGLKLAYCGDATCGAAAAPTASPSPTPGGLLGDVDCNSLIDAIDALMVLRFVANLLPFALCLNVGNVNCDTATDAIDALGVLRHIAHLPVTQGPGCRGIGT